MDGGREASGSGGYGALRGARHEPCSVHSPRGHPAGRAPMSGGGNPCSGTSPAVRRQRQQQQQHQLHHPQSRFDAYLPLCEIQQGLKRGEIVEGVLRVNPRNYEDSYISAPDGLMDIYIRGIRDRNRALNGDVVAVKLNPPQDWKVLWEVIKDCEDRQAKPVLGSSSSPHFSNGPSAGPPAETLPPPPAPVGSAAADSTAVLPRDGQVQGSSAAVPEGDGQAQGGSAWASGWILSDSNQRSADSLEILGLDQLQQQYQAFTKEMKDKKPRNRSRKNRTLQKKQDREETDQSLPPSSNSNSSASPNLQALAEPVCVGSEILVDHNNSNCSLPESDTQDNIVILSATVNCNSNLESSSVSPSGQTFLIDDLGSLNKNDAGDSLPSSSEDELFPKSSAVAPDELSGDEFSNSVSGESAASHQLVQELEDEEFFAEHQDACNNNEPSENFPVDLIVDKELDPALEIQNLIDQAKQLSVSQVSEPEVRATGCTGIDRSENSLTVLGDGLTPTDDGSKLPTADTSATVISEENVKKEEVPVKMKRQKRPRRQPKEDEDDKNHGKVSPKMAASKTNHISEPKKSDADSCNEPTAGLTCAGDAPQLAATDTPIAAHSEQSSVDVSVKTKRKKRHRSKKQKQHAKEDDKDGSTSEIKVTKDAPQTPATRKDLPGTKPPQFLVPRRNVEKQDAGPGANVTVADILKLPDHHRFLQRTGKVVHIIERKHSRAAMGFLKKQQDNSPYWAMFSPMDHRVPRMIIPMVECPKDFYERPEDFKSTLFIAMIKEWDERSTFARGSLARSLGEAGEIEPETEGILLENDVVFTEFSQECLNDLPSFPWQIPQEEIEKRKDFRDHCVFTIDPKTARDLDDAVSVRQLEEGLLEVGVHIADVSFFLQENTPLDLEASRRSTSVYLVQKVVPMLPRVLCEQLCSLNPGEDKLTMSVVWKITPEGHIMDEWFGRTIIHSCTKFSYEHAQDMIESGEHDWQPGELPEFHGQFGVRDVLWCVQTLQGLTVKLRERRFHQGALKLDQIKIQFNLNGETGMPSGFSIYEQRDSNRLIEELMLLANMAVAHKIYKSFPGKAFLRCHPPPQTKIMNDLVETCATLGIHLDPSSAGNLQASLARYTGNDVMSMARNLVLTHLCSKPMKPARYFCSGWTTEKEDFHHYALNVPLYTHFTSPIRRYPDVITHRLLSAALGLGSEPSQTALALQKLSVHCNDKKLTAKRVHEMSCELFLGCFIREVGSLEEAAVVVDVLDHSFDVLIQRMGIVKRVYCDKLSVSKVTFEKQMGIPRLTLTWPCEGHPQVQQIMIFSLVQVVISSRPKETMRFNVIIKPPKVQPSN